MKLQQYSKIPIEKRSKVLLKENLLTLNLKLREIIINNCMMLSVFKVSKINYHLLTLKELGKKLISVIRILNYS